jgi:hypothetical protein
MHTMHNLVLYGDSSLCPSWLKISQALTQPLRLAHSVSPGARLFNEVLDPCHRALTMPVEAGAKLWRDLSEKVLEDKESPMLIHLQLRPPLLRQLGFRSSDIQFEWVPALHPEYWWIIGC